MDLRYAPLGAAIGLVFLAATAADVRSAGVEARNPDVMAART
jgi:hypothetical protein